MLITELADNLLLRGLAPAQLERLAGLFAPADYGAGNMIFRQGDPADHVYVLETGEHAML